MSAILLPNYVGEIAMWLGWLKWFSLYEAEFDLGGAPPGLELRLSGPRTVLDGAIPYGLRLVERRRRTNVYELAPHDEDGEGDGAATGDGRRRLRCGFRGLLLDRPVKLALELRLPDKGDDVPAKHPASGGEHRIVVRQLAGGEVLGAFSIRLRVASPQGANVA